MVIERRRDIFFCVLGSFTLHYDRCFYSRSGRVHSSSSSWGLRARVTRCRSLIGHDSSLVFLSRRSCLESNQYAISGVAAVCFEPRNRLWTLLSWLLYIQLWKSIWFFAYNSSTAAVIERDNDLKDLKILGESKWTVPLGLAFIMRR